MVILASVTATAAAPAAPATAAPAAVPSPAQQSRGVQIDLKTKLTTLDEWDSSVDALNGLAERIRLADQVGNDLGGHNLDYYWQLYVFTPATKETLERLRDQAQKQSVSKDTAGLQRTLDEASAILNAERGKALAVSLFMSAQGPVIFHQYQLGPWLARAPEQDRAAINDKVAATYERLLKELMDVIALREPEAAGVTTGRFFGLLVEPAAFFNAARARLIKAQADLPNPVPVSARARADKPCPAPVQPTQGHDKPSLAPGFPSSEEFYPPRAKFNDLEGAVTLRVSISATGCIERAEIAGTSGVAELDEGALNLAMAGSYVPAAAGGKAVPGTLMFRVKFEQAEAFEPAARQGQEKPAP
jgi:TonB family protein